MKHKVKRYQTQLSTGAIEREAQHSYDDNKLIIKNSIYSDRESLAVAGGPTRPGPYDGARNCGFMGAYLRELVALCLLFRFYA